MIARHSPVLTDLGQSLITSQSLAAIPSTCPPVPRADVADPARGIPKYTGRVNSIREL